MELHNRSYGVPELYRIRRSPDLVALKWQKWSVGHFSSYEPQKSFKPSTVFKADHPTKSADRRILCSSVTLRDKFQSSKIVKWLVGRRISRTWNCQNIWSGTHWMCFMKLRKHAIPVMTHSSLTRVPPQTTRAWEGPRLLSTIPTCQADSPLSA